MRSGESNVTHFHLMLNLPGLSLELCVALSVIDVTARDERW